MTMKESVEAKLKRRRKFRVLLALRGMTAGEAAQAAGITKGSFSKIMNGQNGCRDRTAEKIAEVFGTVRSELLL